MLPAHGLVPLDDLPAEVADALARIVRDNNPDGTELPDGSKVCWNGYCDCCPPPEREEIVWMGPDGQDLSSWFEDDVRAWLASASS